MLIYLLNKHCRSPCFVASGSISSAHAKVCPWGGHGAEGLPRFPLKRLQVPENVTKGVWLGGSRALETGIKKLAVVTPVAVLENECIDSQANSKRRDPI